MGGDTFKKNTTELLLRSCLVLTKLSNMTCVPSRKLSCFSVWLYLQRFQSYLSKHGWWKKILYHAAVLLLPEFMLIRLHVSFMQYFIADGFCWYLKVWFYTYSCIALMSLGIFFLECLCGLRYNVFWWAIVLLYWHQLLNLYLFATFLLMYDMLVALPKSNIAPGNGPSRKETSIRTIRFHVLS